jgi:DNA transposition AAA+ family ATPase
MARHFLGLEGAVTVPTEAFLLTHHAVGDLHEAGALGVVHGEAGLGKTFAVDDALAHCDGTHACTVSFAGRPSMRIVALGLLQALTRTASTDLNRFQATQQLLEELGQRRRVVVVDEAQQLNRECIEYLRHLYDHPATTFALLLVGGDDCWEVLSREPMLRSRVYRRVTFRPLTNREVLSMIGDYHPIYHGVPDELVLFVDDHFGHGNFRNWAAFTRSAQVLCAKTGRERLDEEVARNVFALRGGVATR